MSSLHVLVIETDKNAASVKEIANRGDRHGSTQGLINLLSAGISGAHAMKIDASYGAAKASGTLTFDTVVATDEIVINGVTFACVASGATGNQFNVGSDDEESAANAAAAINASATALIDGYVVATSAGAVLTITAAKPGELGNAITIDSPDATITESGARLTGGSEGTEEAISLGIA